VRSRPCAPRQFDSAPRVIPKLAGRVCEHRPTGSAHEAPIHSRAPGDTAGAAGSAGRLVEGRQCAAHEICQKSAVQCMRRHVPRPIQRPASSTCTRHESAQGTDRQTCRDPDTPSSGPAHPPDHVRPNTVRVKEPCRRGTWPARLLPKQTRLSGARLPLAGQGGYRVRIPPIWRARASSRGRAGTSRQGLGDDVMLVMSAVPGRVQPLRRTAELSPPGGRRSPPRALRASQCSAAPCRAWTRTCPHDRSTFTNRHRRRSHPPPSLHRAACTAIVARVAAQ
jgi:hypothetical protein